MRLSDYFLPTLKETPSEAQIVSHRLMLRAGMIKQVTAGIYSWLPLGYRVLRRIEAIVREEQDRAGCHELLMPTIQPADLWRESGRYDDYGKEMLRFNDRHEREMLYGPTNEEVITDIIRDYVKSYRELPVMLYHIQWKFRDEVRPRFGVMRGREFLMKDAYSFDLDRESARHSYNKMFLAYLRTFERIGLRAIPMRADTGPIGGDLSHEFIILADTGESAVYCHRDWLSMDLSGPGLSYDDDLQPFVDRLTGLYAATDEMHVPDEAPVSGDELVEARGIEVGHIFYFGDNYSKPMNAVVTADDGSQVPVHGGSYGIGVSRLVGAIIEACHDEDGIIWPDSVSPFSAGILNLRPGDDACDALCGDVYGRLSDAGAEALYDDRDERAGAKFADMDLIGLPWQVIVGPRSAKAGVVELKRRATGERSEVSAESAVSTILGS